RAGRPVIARGTEHSLDEVNHAAGVVRDDTRRHGRPPFGFRAANALFVEHAQRIRLVLAERRHPVEPLALVQRDGRRLMDAGLEAQEADTTLARKFRQVVEQQLCVTRAAMLWTNVHALELAIVGAAELDAAATDWHTILPHYEERDA